MEQDEAAKAVVADQRDNVTQNHPPSHILQDGRFIYLAEATEVERRQFLERSIVRHGLLRADLNQGDDQDETDNGDDEKDKKPSAMSKDGADAARGLSSRKGETEDDSTEKDSTQPKLHPLAVASARLQANGVSELSKAINLSVLVSHGDYFSLSNIVNPVVDVMKTKTEESPVATAEMQQDQTLRATFVAKRKRDQFERAAVVLERHKKRLAAALAAQAIDKRLQQLRPQWRLVAPEHGTRAKPHPVRPQEVVSIDVDVYDRDRTGGGNMALLGDGIGNAAAVTRGRLARRVPRFATVELRKGLDVSDDLERWKEVHKLDKGRSGSDASSSDKVTAPDSKKQNGNVENGKNGQNGAAVPSEPNGGQHETNEKTRAEPFAVADPTLGKIDLAFDPEKVPMLSLQLDIDKDSTGFRQSAFLSPLTTLDENAHEDETVVVALQHSLFCASLFEMIRKEIAPHEEDEAGQEQQLGRAKSPGRGMRKSGGPGSKRQANVWMTSDTNVHFLPPPSLMAGAEGLGGRGALAVIHCHEGEVKVQLDAEYSLTVKLVEAGTATKNNSNGTSEGKNGSKTAGVDAKDDAMDIDTADANTLGVTEQDPKDSGSQSRKKLHVLCRALLLHAQHVYHKYSIDTRELLKKMAKERESQPRGLERIRKEQVIPPARILQKCVCLGGRMLFEGRIRSVLLVSLCNGDSDDAFEALWT